MSETPPDRAALQLNMLHGCSALSTRFLPVCGHFCGRAVKAAARVTGKSQNQRFPSEETVRVLMALKYYILTLFYSYSNFFFLLCYLLPEICLLQFFGLNPGLFGCEELFLNES